MHAILRAKLVNYIRTRSTTGARKFPQRLLDSIEELFQVSVARSSRQHRLELILTVRWRSLRKPVSASAVLISY